MVPRLIPLLPGLLITASVIAVHSESDAQAAPTTFVLTGLDYQFSKPDGVHEKWAASGIEVYELTTKANYYRVHHYATGTDIDREVSNQITNMLYHFCRSDANAYFRLSVSPSPFEEKETKHRQVRRISIVPHPGSKLPAMHYWGFSDLGDKSAFVVLAAPAEGENRLDFDDVKVICRALQSTGQPRPPQKSN